MLVTITAENPVVIPLITPTIESTSNSTADPTQSPITTTLTDFANNPEARSGKLWFSDLETANKIAMPNAQGMIEIINPTNGNPACHSD
jgi:hypothetical protein